MLISTDSKAPGTWHVAARMPSFFEKDCVNSFAVYSLTEDPKVIGVKNVCDDVENPGEQIEVTGTAEVQDEGNSKLKVKLNRFPGNLVAGNLWVIHLDEENYNWVIVSEPKGRYLWIMGREEVMDENLLADLISWVKADGWDTSALIMD
ncbi:MAG: lipocalin family protein [Bdellovibrionales bacterium]